MTEQAKRFLVVREHDTNKEIHRVEVTGKGESTIGRVEMGMMRKIDLDRFWLDDVTEGESDE